jgi:hypothetical protein
VLDAGLAADGFAGPEAPQSAGLDEIAAGGQHRRPECRAAVLNPG